MTISRHADDFSTIHPRLSHCLKHTNHPKHEGGGEGDMQATLIRAGLLASGLEADSSTQIMSW